MSTPKYAPKNIDGLAPYVQTTRTVGDLAEHDRIVWAADFKEAKRQYGSTRALHTHVSVRRATPEDMAAR